MPRARRWRVRRVDHGAGLPREHRDHALRATFGILPGASLLPFGIDSGPLLGALNAVVVKVRSAATVVDVLREDAAGVIWHLEFETSTGEPTVLIRHHLAVVERHPGRDVRTVIFWCGGQRPRIPLVAGECWLFSHQVRLADIDAEAHLARWLRAAAAGDQLCDDDLLMLAPLPLLGLTRPVIDMLPDAVAAFAAVPAARRLPVFDITWALAYNQTEEADRPRLEEVLRTMPLGQEYYAMREREKRDAHTEGRQEGRQEGREEMRGEMLAALRAGVVEDYADRFGRPVPRDVERAVGRLDSVAETRRASRAILDAPDVVTARRALGL